MNPLSDVHWSFVLLVLVLAGCSGAKSTVSTSSDPNAFPPALERYVNPFTILDGEGEPMDLSLLGGLNVPRPQFVDIDGDGDDDLFLQENTGNLMFFDVRITSIKRIEHKYQQMQ